MGFSEYHHEYKNVPVKKTNRDKILTKLVKLTVARRSWFYGYL